MGVVGVRPSIASIAKEARRLLGDALTKDIRDNAPNLDVKEGEHHLQQKHTEEVLEDHQAKLNNLASIARRICSNRGALGRY
jgi:hypothetical protein